MTAILVEAVNEVYLRIDLKKTLAGFVFNDFTLEKTWLPTQRLEKMKTDHPGGKVYVIGLAADDGLNKSRTNMSLREIPVQIGFQKQIDDIADFDALAQLVEFEEQLRDVCRKDVNHDALSWSRNESLKDENGVPFSFVGLREGGFFEVYFTAFYNYVLTP